MKENPLQTDLNNLGESIGTTVGMLFQLKSHLQDYKKILIERFKSIKNENNYPILETTLVFGDLTGNSENGWKINFPTDYSFKLELGKIDCQIDLLIDRESMRSIAYSYEMLEKYLFDITAKYLFLNSTRYSDLVKSKINPIDETIDSYTIGIRNLRGRNNKEILSLIRKISEHFYNAELKNNEGIDLIDWFEVLSRVRHGIIHSSFRLKKDIKQPLTVNQISILNRYFPNLEKNDFYDLKIKEQDAGKMLDLMAEYAFLVFKSLSIEGGYNWKIFRNMDGLRVNNS